eukprot:EG_transcript_14750
MVHGGVVYRPALRVLGALIGCLLLCLVLAWGFPRVPAVVRTVERLKEKMTDEERRDPIIVAETNSQFHPMALWWIANMRRLGLKKFVIVALDIGEYRRLKKMGLVVVWHPGLDMNYSLASFRTKEYNEIVNYKWQIVLDLLRAGHDVLLTDVDIYWRRNPVPYLRTLPYCHMYVSVDLKELPPDETSTLNPKPPRVYPPFTFDEENVVNRANTGFCYLRSNPHVMRLAEAVLRKPLPGKDDQYTFNAHFNELLETHKARSKISHGPQMCANYGDLTFQMLRPDLFQNRLFHNLYPQFNDKYYTLHFNWLVDYNEKMKTMIAEGFMNASYQT